MFLGRYHHAIDGKGRLTIPARYRELLAHGQEAVRGRVEPGTQGDLCHRHALERRADLLFSRDF